jgi:hypothetical protein
MLFVDLSLFGRVIWLSHTHLLLNSESDVSYPAPLMMRLVDEAKGVPMMVSSISSSGFVLIEVGDIIALKQ